MDLAGLVDPGFEPQQRARSNTWPLPRPDDYVDPIGGSTTSPANLLGGPAKKNSSRRNAWGNLSYADLITQAITTAPEKRLTLSQIYEYMVHNVPYFKDKGDSNSSAGWKNSIRHNLSLHNRFMRVQNEGTGKSSWWMINPDAKPGKSARRRATSMETSKFEKRRGRVKKKVEALRNGLTLDHTPSPSSSVSEGLDLFPESPIHGSGYQLSPDFRPRASSNASSCGRLSPIPSLAGEPEWSYDQLSVNLQETMKLQHQEALMQNYAPSYCYDANYMAASPYGCALHRLQPCACALPPAAMSPSYPPTEPAPDPQFSRCVPRAPQPRSPSTMMGQLMGALNNSTLLDDLNLNIETLHGGFDCNVDEVIKHELSMDGSLDFNFPAHQAHAQHAQDSAAQSPAQYSNTGHWVH